MDGGDTVSVLLYRTSKPQGKVKRRVQDLRIPSSSYLDYLANRPALDLSHNESARLATDCLLNGSLDEYHQVLKAEGEVDFLSEPEKSYILENGNQGNTDDHDEDDDADKELESLSAGSESSTCLEVSTDSDSTLAEMHQSNMTDVSLSDAVMDKSCTEVFFPSHSTVASMKDLVRHVIRKAKQALAIVMDSFSDVELLCDLLEASRKRNISVHLLLDHLNLNLFVSMWQDLKLNSKDFPKLSVRSVHGETYRAKTGGKLPGQIAESFIITDWTEVLAGSFSFSWLYWQVHRSLMVLLKGSSVVAPFHQEFHRLYSSSQAVAGFVTFITVPNAVCPRSALRTARRNNSTKERKSYPGKDMCQWVKNAAAVTFSHSLTEPDYGKAGGPSLLRTEAQDVCVKPSVRPGGGRAVQSVPVGLQVQTRVKVDHHTQSHFHPRTLFSNIHSQLAGLSINATDVKSGRIQEFNPPSLLPPGQQKAAHHHFRKKSHQDTRTEGLSFQQRVRNLLAKPFGVTGGLDAHSAQWNCSLSFKSKAELSSSSASLQKRSTSNQHSNLVHPRRHVLELQTNSHYQPAHQAQQSSRSAGSRAVPSGPHLGSQLHTDSKWSHSSPRAKPPFRRLPLERTYGWSPLGKHAALERQSSFCCSRGPGPPGWRPLPRSKSMPERRTAGFRRVEGNPHRMANLQRYTDDWTH